MTPFTSLVLASTLILLLTGGVSAQVRHYPLDSTDGLRLHNVKAEPAMLQAKKGFPSKYESDVDLMPGVWTRIKIEVRGERARLYVHGQEQPTLIVNDLRSGLPCELAVRIGS